jgi:hypothetical protein
VNEPEVAEYEELPKGFVMVSVYELTVQAADDEKVPMVDPDTMLQVEPVKVIVDGKVIMILELDCMSWAGVRTTLNVVDDCTL